ncbi:hypothetical protein GQX74_011045 [Glossina fuscipes]|nr:hypothetical protein GQX74_011045 [Glossina fuscipes]
MLVWLEKVDFWRVSLSLVSLMISSWTESIYRKVKPPEKLGHYSNYPGKLFGLPKLLVDCSWVGNDPVEEFEVSLICMAGAGICCCAVAAAEFCAISKECRLRGVVSNGADEKLTRWTSMVEGVVHDCKRLLLFKEAEEFESLEFKAGERGPAGEGLILLLILLGLNVTEFCEVLTKTDELPLLQLLKVLARDCPDVTEELKYDAALIFEAAGADAVAVAAVAVKESDAGADVDDEDDDGLAFENDG